MNVRIPHVTNTHIHRAHPHLPACSHHPSWPSSLALSPVLPSIPIGLEATPANVVMRIAFTRLMAAASDGPPTTSSKIDDTTEHTCGFVQHAAGSMLVGKSTCLRNASLRLLRSRPLEHSWISLMLDRGDAQSGPVVGILWFLYCDSDMTTSLVSARSLATQSWFLRLKVAFCHQPTHQKRRFCAPTRMRQGRDLNVEWQDRTVPIDLSS